MTSPLTDGLEVRENSKSTIVRRFLKRPDGIIASLVLIVVIVVAVLAPWIAPFDPNVVDISSTRAAPDSVHWLGGDVSGRDVLSRLIYGSRSTLWGAMVAIVTSLVLGVPSGLAAGYFGRATDRVGTWTSDALQAVPGMVILLIVAASTKNDFTLLMITVGVLMAPGYFRLTRSTVLAVRNEPYVDAAIVAGLTHIRIMARHIVRAITAPIVIQTALTAGMAMGMQAGLQFLGIGGGTTPGWGAAMNEGFHVIRTDPLLLLWPSLALGVTIAALAVLGSTVGDSVNVRSAVVTSRQRRQISRRAIADRSAREKRAAEAGVRVARAAASQDVAAEAGTAPALSVDNLRVSYVSKDGETEVVHGTSFSVDAGEVLGIVGESGSGKSQTVFSVLGLLPHTGYHLADSIYVDGRDVTTLDRRERSKLLGHVIGYIPQEPMSNLDPSFTIGFQLTEPLTVVHGLSRTAARQRALEMLDKVGISDPAQVMKSYPHELSGGMAQRVLIAGAIAGKPKILIADEPTTALDVTVQAEVLELLRELQSEYSMALVIVTHDFGVVADICDRVVVMRAGEVVETNDVSTLFESPHEEYTRELISSTMEGTASRRALDEESGAVEETGQKQGADR